MPFDPDLELSIHNGSSTERFLAEDSKAYKVEEPYKSGNFVTYWRARFRNAARYATFVEHREVDTRKNDPRGFDWLQFIAVITAQVHPSASGAFGALIDTSATDSSTGDPSPAELNAANTTITAISAPAALPLLSNTDPELIVPANAIFVLPEGSHSFSKVYIGKKQARDNSTT